MQLTFRNIASLSALAFLVLTLVWMFSPNILLSDWGVEFTASTGLVGRRAAAMYAGIAVMLWSARNVEPSTGRTALINGILVTCLMLATLGIYEYLAGHATVKILAAVFIDIAFSFAFLLTKLTKHEAGKK